MTYGIINLLVNICLNIADEDEGTQFSRVNFYVCNKNCTGAGIHKKPWYINGLGGRRNEVVFRCNGQDNLRPLFCPPIKRFESRTMVIIKRNNMKTVKSQWKTFFSAIFSILPPPPLMKYMT